MRLHRLRSSAARRGRLSRGVARGGAARAMSPLGRGMPALVSSPALMAALLAFTCVARPRARGPPRRPGRRDLSPRGRASSPPRASIDRPMIDDRRPSPVAASSSPSNDPSLTLSPSAPSPVRPARLVVAASRRCPRSSRTGASRRRPIARPSSVVRAVVAQPPVSPPVAHDRPPSPSPPPPTPTPTPGTRPASSTGRASSAPEACRRRTRRSSSASRPRSG